MTRQIAPDHHDHHDDHDHGVVEPATVVVERHEEPVVEKPSRVGPFLAGVLTTLVAGAVALIVFLAVSDSDDDGNINVDVPAVDVDIDG